MTVHAVRTHLVLALTSGVLCLSSCAWSGNARNATSASRSDLDATAWVDPSRLTYGIRISNGTSRAHPSPWADGRANVVPGGVYIEARTKSGPLTWFSLVRGVLSSPWSPYAADNMDPPVPPSLSVAPGSELDLRWSLRPLLTALVQNLTPQALDRCRSEAVEIRLLFEAGLPADDPSDRRPQNVISESTGWTAVDSPCASPPS